MMQYRVTISNRGSVVASQIINAVTALQAIAVVEQGLPQRPYTLSTKGAQTLTVRWTGYEFEARKVAS